MLLPVPHREQSTGKTCVPACVQMILEFQGVSFSESQLDGMLGTTEEGTRLDNIGLLASLDQIESITVARLTQDQLEASLTDALPVIV